MTYKKHNVFELNQNDIDASNTDFILTQFNHIMGSWLYT